MHMHADGAPLHGYNRLFCLGDISKVKEGQWGPTPSSGWHSAILTLV